MVDKNKKRQVVPTPVHSLWSRLRWKIEDRWYRPPYTGPDAGWGWKFKSFWYRNYENRVGVLRWRTLWAVQYVRMRLRIWLLRLVVNWPRLRRALVQDPVLKTIEAQHLHHLWEQDVLCVTCSEAMGRRQTYPLGDFNMTSVVAPHGATQVVTLVCPVCNCAIVGNGTFPQRMLVTYPPRFFNFRLGTFTPEP